MKDWYECRDKATLINDAMYGFAALLSTGDNLNGNLLWQVSDLATLIANAQEAVLDDMEKYMKQCPHKKRVGG